MDALLESVFGDEAMATAKPWSVLPYQMLTAIVGTAIEASDRDCALGVLCIHELVTESAKPGLLARNQKQFEAFLYALGERASSAEQLYGPFDIRISGKSQTVPILLGKATYDWTAR